MDPEQWLSELKRRTRLTRFQHTTKSLYSRFILWESPDVTWILLQGQLELNQLLAYVEPNDVLQMPYLPESRFQELIRLSNFDEASVRLYLAMICNFFSTESFGDGLCDCYEYPETLIVTSNNKSNDVLLKISESGRANMFSELKINGSILSLDSISPGTIYSFLDGAKVEYEMRDAPNCHSWIKDRYGCVIDFYDRCGIPELRISAPSLAQFTVRATSETLQMPFTNTEMASKLGKPYCTKLNARF